MYHQNSDMTNLLKSAWKKSAPEFPFECEGGAIWAMDGVWILKVLSSENTIREQLRDLYRTLGSWLNSPVEQMTPSPSLPPQLSVV